MAWGPPNLATASFPNQAKLFDTDLNILASSAGGATGVVSGCAVTTLGTMQLAVASGTIKSVGTEQAVTGGNVTITAAHATFDRFDLIVVSSSGVKSVVAGTAAASPVPPAVPAGSVCLTQVYVPANDTVIGSTQLTDRQITVQPNPVSSPWTRVGKGTDQVKVSDTTLAVDSVLKFTMLANTKYGVRGRVHVGTESGTPDFKYRFAGPASPTLVLIRHSYANPTSGADTVAMLNAYSAADHIGLNFSTAFETFLWFDATIHNGANAGDFQFQWAQQTSSVDDTIVRASSYLEYA